MSKYAPLHHFLLRLSPHTTKHVLTFADIEYILGSVLPKSAYHYRQWWANIDTRAHCTHAHAWFTAGWIVQAVDQHEQWVCFQRR